jgi:hypothetical protein
MKRISISIGVFLVAFTTTFAQFQINSMNLAFSGGWSLMNIEESSNSVNGYHSSGLPTMWAVTGLCTAQHPSHFKPNTCLAVWIQKDSLRQT